MFRKIYNMITEIYNSFSTDRYNVKPLKNYNSIIKFKSIPFKNSFYIEKHYLNRYN